MTTEQQYHFDPITRVYTRSSDRMVNPKAPDEFFSVMYASPEPLPALGDNETARRLDDDSGWEVVEDYRGTVYSTITKEPVTVTEVGPLPADLTLLQPGEFDVWNGDTWETDYSAMNRALVKQGVYQIDSLCDEVYTFHVSRATRYEQKYREAVDYQAGVERTYQYLPAESAARGLTQDELAVLIIDAADTFNGFGAAVEVARVELVAAVDNAATYDAKLQAMDTVFQPLKTAAQGLL